ncbi:hypothetical protein L195_g052056 [Trifolium pratense]|uniref:Uncharacterized protein n=1 Tax=Trifolium pratense TaxID=57577 RepID=A0A2K3K328_TRIPR|nr:hypothetical protein L195_g052056 [Trifolium pratense]
MFLLRDSIEKNSQSMNNKLRWMGLNTSGASYKRYSVFHHLDPEPATLAANYMLI